MTKYSIKCTQTISYHVFIDADSLENAISLIEPTIEKAPEYHQVGETELEIWNIEVID